MVDPPAGSLGTDSEMVDPPAGSLGTDSDVVDLPAGSLTTDSEKLGKRRQKRSAGFFIVVYLSIPQFLFHNLYYHQEDKKPVFGSYIF